MFESNNSNYSCIYIQYIVYNNSLIVVKVGFKGMQGIGC